MFCSRNRFSSSLASAPYRQAEPTGRFSEPPHAPPERNSCMSLRAWLRRRVSCFFSWIWLDRADRLARSARPKNTYKPRPFVRLELGSLEPRETPDDLYGILQGGMVLGGLPLLSGQLDTPLTALLRAWRAPALRVPDELAARPLP